MASLRYGMPSCIFLTVPGGMKCIALSPSLMKTIFAPIPTPIDDSPASLKVNAARTTRSRLPSLHAHKGDPQDSLRLVFRSQPHKSTVLESAQQPPCDTALELYLRNVALQLPISSSASFSEAEKTAYELFAGMFQ